MFSNNNVSIKKIRTRTKPIEDRKVWKFEICLFVFQAFAFGRNLRKTNSCYSPTQNIIITKITALFAVSCPSLSLYIYEYVFWSCLAVVETLCCCCLSLNNNWVHNTANISVLCVGRLSHFSRRPLMCMLSVYLCVSDRNWIGWFSSAVQPFTLHCM